MSGKQVSVDLENIGVTLNTHSDPITLIVPDPIVTENTSNLTTTLHFPDPIVTENTSNLKTELVLPQPFKTESTSNLGLDIRPMVMDFCIKFEIGKLPSACIRRPYQHHFGITLFGIEVMGLNFAGESRIMIEEMQKQPQVVWGNEHGMYAHERQHEAGPDSGGLRIRLDT